MTTPDDGHVFIKLNHNFQPPGITIDHKPFEGAVEYITLADHERLVKEAVEAEMAAVNALSDDYPRPVAVAYNDDKSYSRHDCCAHGLTMYQECAECLADAIRARGVTP